MYLKIKRLLDIMFAIIGLILISPILILVSIAIKLDSQGPVFFLQDRLGKNGKVFKIIKFRSMCVGAEKIGSGVYCFKNDSRITTIGNFIRKTSIDELPQFINILKGDMSFIGPRPTLTYHPYIYENYTKEQKVRFEVLPGVTGYAQVRGRKDVPWEERIKLDVEYVNNINIVQDIKILFATIKVVFSMTDNYNTCATGKEKIENIGE